VKERWRRKRTRIRSCSLIEKEVVGSRSGATAKARVKRNDIAPIWQSIRLCSLYNTSRSHRV
jgi:hypothetical protein